MHKKPRFRQNALHDHESIWWVAIWMQFYLVRPGDTLLPDHHRNFDNVFSRTGGRSHFWLGPGAYLAFTTQFPDESNFQEVMSVWKNSLKGCYTASYTAENYVVIDVDIIDEAHEAQKEALRLLREGTQDYPLELSCLADLDPVVSEPEVPPSTTAESSELTKGSLDSGSPLST
ncbi:hypothetical protein BDV93DRAFT_520674 [Ceratobasidium sp. AG-I]|nr:hypothetical protein BDV93DRAFT_520674 [Ceratobasidium sp. AG-I]